MENPGTEQWKGKEDPKITFIAGDVWVQLLASPSFLPWLPESLKLGVFPLKKGEGWAHCSVPALKGVYKADRGSRRCGAEATSCSFHAYNINPMVL